jgi:alkanesulfonate monooxygenase SsuD/methylene tetrahydromethanopterin reductase-like flavin-dependent oxidoreductase (luciferase family)
MVDFVPSEFDHEAIQSALDAIPLGMLERAVFWGTPDKVAAEIGEMVDVGLRHPVVIPVPGLGVPGPDEPDSHYRVVRILNKRYG